MGTIVGLISTNLSSPSEAYETARNLVKTAVSLEQVEKGTKSAAIASLTKKGRFGSWLLKLHKGHSVSVHLHLYVRLVELVEQLAAKSREEADRIEAMVAEAKGVNNAGSDRTAGRRAGGDHSQSTENCQRQI